MNKETIEAIRNWLAEIDTIINDDDMSEDEKVYRIGVWRSTQQNETREWLMAFINYYDSNEVERKWVRLMLAHYSDSEKGSVDSRKR